MGTISSSIGLVSGINTGQIIDQLMSLEERPKTLLQSQKDQVGAQKAAYTGVLGQLSDLQTIAQGLQRPTTFTVSTAKSTDENVLTATAGPSAALGSFQFQVAQLVTSQQSVTGGYSSASATVGAGTLTIEMGGGNLDAETPLSQLNGGVGVTRGQFRITDRSGKSAVIDASSAVTLDDVIHKINTSLDISVRASLKGDQVVLTDSTGQTASDLIVQDVGDGKTAAGLGIAGDATTNVLTGTDINSLGTGTALNTLNDGRGVRFSADGTPDVRIAVGGVNVDVGLSGSLTVGDIINKINTAGTGKVTASVATGGNGITLTSTGGGAFNVTALNNSKAAVDLGILKNSTGGTLTGTDVLAGLDTVLVSSLKGGSGLPLGKISITDRSLQTKQVDLTGAKSVQDILDTINNTSGLSVTASLNASRNGIQITDRSGGTGNLVIGDVDSTTAAALGIAGTFDNTKAAAAGSNLQLQWVSENTLLSNYNGGKGVTPGSFKITNSAGQGTTIDLSNGTFNTLGDVIDQINTSGKNLGITASINANGDGLLLTDAANGAGKLKVENTNGTAATDLNIAGTATATTIDGSFEKTIDVTAADTLTTVQGKIQSLGFGVSANIINDGSGQSPYRLSLSAFNSGRAGRVTLDAGTTSLQTQDLVQAQDAAVFLGGQGTAQPLLITSSQNQLTNVIPGVTVNLAGVSSGPVTLNITRDPDSVVDQAQKFVDGFNAIIDKINDLTKFDADTQQGGLLLGENTIDQVQSKLYVALQSVVQGAGRYRVLSDVGITLGDGAKLQFDSDKFRSAFATDEDAVKNLFTQTSGTVLNNATKLSVLNGGRGVGVGNGADFRITARDGSNYDITLPIGGTVGDVTQAINTATAGKVTAGLAADGRSLQLTDASTGASILTVAALNGSSAASDLGISGTNASGTLVGKQIFSPNSASGGGFGYLITQGLTSLTDPVDGVIPQENQTLDTRSQQFQDRIDQLDSLLADKRSRLQEQFANMESVLSKLQSQQSALGSLSSIKTSAA